MPTLITFLTTGVASAYRDRERLRNWLTAVAKDHGHSIGELNYVLMSDKELLKYNREFLKHDEYTDVITFDAILTGLNKIFAAIEAACGLRIAFDREDRHGHQNSHSFYLRYQGPLPAANDVKVDITINEVLCFPLQDRPIHRIYDGFDDLPKGPTVKVYDIKEIIVEKLLALSDRARNEPRDLYDLWYLFGATDLRVAEMRAELDAKLALRQRIVAGMDQAIAAKKDRLQRLWTARLAHQICQLPPFDDVFREVLRAVRAADLPKAGG